MRDITTFKAAQNMDNSVDFPNVRKKLIAKTFTSRSATHKSGNIDKFQLSWNQLGRF